MSAIVNKIHTAPAAAAFLSIGLFQGITVTLLMSVVLLQWQEYARPTVIQVPRGYSIPTNFSHFYFWLHLSFVVHVGCHPVKEYSPSGACVRGQRGLFAPGHFPATGYRGGYRVAQDVNRQ
ncbi:hypothetical protein H9Q69_009940 [Fusarium xylarioides]|uniref:Uncharacterized protein n=1 Tax=Fusarium xylarioides TaxID=221167 RepID=A0A9P7HI21_9HYPO|nr:hypothetical protein H9Q70_000193 [Fusarium xylarioides]KAG5757986.1 hypothetical protein H9Q72_013880 [Fusarium xylarioides]KAG5786218.1 hypothetical protein H9Q73_000158 [Fusarium xylarioides]KAG5790995.1 hypothetical protein H9Q69_009940 [Fusarium xylarioides]